MLQLEKEKNTALQKKKQKETLSKIQYLIYNAKFCAFSVLNMIANLLLIEYFFSFQYPC